MRWTQEEYEAYQNRRASQGAKLERSLGHEPLETHEAASPDTRQRKISIRSFRCRLIDPDNLCCKYHIDGLRYVGALRDDTAKDITLEVSQVKVKTKHEERTDITLE